MNRPLTLLFLWFIYPTPQHHSTFSLHYRLFVILPLLHASRSLLSLYSHVFQGKRNALKYVLFTFFPFCLFLANDDDDKKLMCNVILPVLLIHHLHPAWFPLSTAYRPLMFASLIVAYNDARSPPPTRIACAQGSPSSFRSSTSSQPWPRPSSFLRSGMRSIVSPLQHHRVACMLCACTPYPPLSLPFGPLDSLKACLVPPSQQSLLLGSLLPWQLSPLCGSSHCKYFYSLFSAGETFE